MRSNEGAGLRSRNQRANECERYRADVIQLALWEISRAVVGSRLGTGINFALKSRLPERSGTL